MGAIALIRQTFFDAAWQEALKAAGDARYEPSALDALARARSTVPSLRRATDELDVLRAGKIAREFGRVGGHPRLRAPSSSGCHAIAAQGLPLIVPLPLRERPQRRVGRRSRSPSISRDLMTWEQAPTNPRRLDAAGLTVALTTSKARGPREVPRVAARGDPARPLRGSRARDAHDEPRGDSRAADRASGPSKPGQVANLVVVRRAGLREGLEDPRGLDRRPGPRGLSPVGRAPAANGPSRSIRPTAADVRIIGRPRRSRARDGRDRPASARARRAITKDRITIVTDAVLAQASPGLSTLTGMIEGATMAGTGTLAERRAVPLDRDAGSGIRDAARRSSATTGRRRGPSRDPRTTAAEGARDSSATPSGPTRARSCPSSPSRCCSPAATVWTSGQGRERSRTATCSCRAGKIAAVGNGRPADVPAGTRRGRRRAASTSRPASSTATRTPASRAASTRAARPSPPRSASATSSIPTRSPGTASSPAASRRVNSLHGSANAIGGQNCVIKLRWGVTHPDEMQFEERVARHQVRARREPEAVELRATGARRATRRRAWASRRSSATGSSPRASTRRRGARSRTAAARASPPRRDLELEALAEILAGQAPRPLPPLPAGRDPDALPRREGVRLHDRHVPAHARGLQGRRRDQGSRARRVGVLATGGRTRSRCRTRSRRTGRSCTTRRRA